MVANLLRICAKHARLMTKLSARMRWARIVQPYLQLVKENERCPHTGLLLKTYLALFPVYLGITSLHNTGTQHVLPGA